MSPVVHLMGSWLIGSVATKNPRDRQLVAMAGVIPDLDGFGMIVDVARSVVTDQPMTFQLYSRYHHILCHGWPAAIVLCGLLMYFARERWRTFALCLLTFHLLSFVIFSAHAALRRAISGRSVTASQSSVTRYGFGKVSGSWMAGRTRLCS